MSVERKMLMKTTTKLILCGLLAVAAVAWGDQLSVGHSWSSGEGVTSTKLNDSVAKAALLPGSVGEQTPYTGALAATDELLLHRVSDGSLVRVTVAQIQPPPGVMLDYAGSSAPAGWLLCDGSAVSRTTYASLFAAIGTAYGSGDGSTTFNVPDTRGRVVAGLDTRVSGTFAARLTATGTGTAGIDSTVLGAAGGVDRYALIAAQVPFPTLSLVTDNNFTKTGSSIGVTSGSLSFGGVQAHPIVQPTIIAAKIIKY